MKFRESPKNALNSRLLKIFTLIFILGCSYISLATNYTTTSNGNYHNCAIWSPTCPPSLIPLGDTVFINHNVILQADLDISGVLVVDIGDTLSGNFKISVLGTGVLINDGGVDITQELHVDGSIFNNGYIYANEVHNDGYICNVGIMEIHPSEVFKIHNGTLECGGLVIACDVNMAGGGSELLSQDLCCSTGALPAVNSGVGTIDSLNVSLCGQFLALDAGNDSVVSICNAVGNTLDLTTLLSTNADSGGVWAETTNSGVFNTVTTIFSVAGLPAGPYLFTYSIAGLGGVFDTSNFTVNVIPMVFAGADSNITTCNSDGLSFNLSTLLSGADPGGTWTDSTNSNAFDSLTTIFTTSGITPGVYSFYYTATAPCLNDTAFFNITVTLGLWAGRDTVVNACNSVGATTVLSTLLSTGADLGGVWAETTGSGSFIPASSVFSTNGLAATTFSFTYIVTDVAPCINDTAYFDVAVQPLVFAGEDSTVSICNSIGSFVDLSTLLNGADPGGGWTEATSSATFDSTTTIFDTDGLAPGTYKFFYTAFAPCLNDTANFTVIVVQDPTAGFDSVITACNSAGNVVDLSTLLSGSNATGTWTETSFSGTFNPLTAVFNTDGLSAGVYTFRYVVSSTPCFNDTSNFTVTVIQEALAGADSIFAICNTLGSSINISSLLNGADLGGVWSESSSSNAFNTGTSILNTDGLTAGTYIFNYVVPGVLACADDTSIFTINVVQESLAGTDSTISVCNSIGTIVDLSTLLKGADIGGIWVETSVSGVFNPITSLLNVDGLTPASYTFLYTVNGVLPCTDDSSNFTVNVIQESFAGVDSTVSTCNLQGSTINLSSLLNSADVGGVWAETSASGAFNMLTSILNTDGLTAGSYTFTYTVAGTLPCLDDVSDFIVVVEQEVFAGADSTVSACNSAGTIVDLSSLLNGADSGGVWEANSASGAFNPVTSVFNTNGLAAGSYTFSYVVMAVTPCENDTSNFTINIIQEVFAGSDNTYSTCNLTNSTINLSTLLLGADAGGVWTETSASGTFNSSTVIFNTDALSAGNYNFIYVISASPCITDTAFFSIDVEQEVFAGLDNTISICNLLGSSVDLSTLLNGADNNGVWQETSSSGVFDPVTVILNTEGLTAGTYTFTYTVSGVLPCADDVADFTVVVEQEVFAGDDGNITICNATLNTIDINTLLIGNSIVGQWSELTNSGQFDPITGMFNASGLAAGTYSFNYITISTAPCADDTAIFTIDVIQESLAGADSTASICHDAGNAIDLNTLLNGNNAIGTWTELTSSGQFDPVTGVFDVSNLAGDKYIFDYTIAATVPCQDDQAGFIITVHEKPTISAGVDLEFCDGESAILNGTGAGAGGSYLWDNAVLDGMSFIPSLGNTSFTVIGTDIYGCFGTDNLDVIVHPIPIVDFEADSVTGCNPLTVSFTNLNQSQNNEACTWILNDIDPLYGCDKIVYTFQSSGVYDVGLTIKSIHGCVGTKTNSNYINVVEQPIAVFEYLPNDIDILNTEVYFNNYSLNSDSYQWNFGDASSIVYELDPIHLFPEIGEKNYKVSLIASNYIGCESKTSTILKINDILIYYIPNVVTLGRGSFNNEFKPIFTAGYDIYNYRMTIFNRWGEVVFQSYNSDIGWDGKYNNRDLVNQGVYICKIEFTNTRNDKRHNEQTYFTVLK